MPFEQLVHEKINLRRKINLLLGILQVSVENQVPEAVS